MKTAALLMSTLFAFLRASPGLTEEVQEIHWQDLVPAHLRAADPLAHLSEEDQGMVNWVIYMLENMPKEVAPEDKDLIEELNKELANIKKKGLDIDKIIAWRREFNTSIAPELDGKTIRLAGYLLPLDMSGAAIKEFLLVPYFGACIHVPPPPPNQIVHVAMQGETGYPSDGLFEPVAVTGMLSSKALTKDLFLGDGSGDINIGYTIEAHRVEPYKEEIR
jgi:hypothetical protein